METRLLVIAALACFLSSSNLNAQLSLWRKADNSSYNSYTTSSKGATPGKLMLAKIDLAQLNTILRAAPLERTDGKFTKGVPFPIILPDETILNTVIVESPIWETSYAAQFSKIKTYTLSDPISKSSLGRITLTAEGISGIIFTERGDVYINPVNLTEAGTHLLYYTKDTKESMPQCGAIRNVGLQPSIINIYSVGKFDDSGLINPV